MQLARIESEETEVHTKTFGIYEANTNVLDTEDCQTNRVLDNEYTK